MPQNSSPIKRLRRDAKRRLINKSRISRIRTFAKKFDFALKSNTNVNEALCDFQSEISRGVSKGLLHKNNAARKISRAMKKINSLQNN